jgi:hypothetical protein
MPHEFEAQDGDMRTTAFPGIKRVNGTNVPLSGYAFDASTEEALFFRFRASDYVSGNVVVDLDWYPDTATSGNVVWGASISAITPGDAQDLETDALSTVATATTAATGTHRLARTVITITATESLSTNDQVVLRVARIAANGSDTMTGDAVLTYVSVNA